MSFSRAKLHRFNDIQDPTPSPADYNPTSKDRVGGVVISQTERFTEQRSPAVSDSLSLTSNSSVCFRTPTLPKKKKSVIVHKQSSTPLLFSTTSDDTEALQEKIVECNNKDLYIKELTEQIDEIKLQVSDLQNQNELLVIEKNQFENKTEHLMREYCDKLETLTLQHNSAVKNKENIIDEIIMERKLLVEEMQEQEKCRNANLTRTTESHLCQIEILKVQHKTEVENVKFDMLKTINLLQNELEREQNNRAELRQQLQEEKSETAQAKDDYEKAIALIQAQTEGTIKDLEASWQSKLERQEKEAEEILKECQEISEYNIIQCEIEKNKFKHELCETKIKLESVERESEGAKRQAERAYENLKSDFDRICVEVSLLKESRDQAVTDKHAYEVTISKTHETIEALKKRLFDSDKDVEQLKRELEISELSKLESDAECNRLLEELELAKKINDDLELQNESTVKTSQENILTIQRDLLEKIEKYKQAAEETIKKVNDKLDQKNSELQEVFMQLRHQHTLNSESRLLLQKAASENEQLERSLEEYKLTMTSTSDTKEIESLLKQITQLQEKSESYYKYCEYYKRKANDYEQEIEEMNKINKNYIDQSRKYDELLRNYEELLVGCSELQAKVSEQEALIGPFREQLEAFDHEYNGLLTQKCNYESEAKAIGLKYADLIGHHNQKQKIKHMIDLKSKNTELAESKMQLEQKVRGQAKTIEKLKKELATFKKSPKKNLTAGKENLNVTSSPLRNRN